MNYKSQLRGWAVDRIIEMWKIVPPSAAWLAKNGDKEANKQYYPNKDEVLPILMNQADTLAAYAYVAREDLETTAKDLFDLVRNAPPNESSADSLIATLEHIKHERISQGIDTDGAAA